ncbi:MAG: tyrosine-type recombinase/integrase, partial [Elusimicrobia bacterium]|nr:tyrosine-type recombinase/integrase [Elusimicrobiota bacterium]
MSQNIKCLDSKEEETLLNVLSKRKDAERAHMLYRLMLVTGLRISEALRLNVEDVERAKIEVKVKGWTRDGEKLERVKTVYLPKALQEHLIYFLHFKRRKGESIVPDAPLFVSRESGRLSARQAQRDFKKWLKEASIKGNFTPHALRHTAATNLLRRTGNAKLVQRYLGHS